MYSTLDFEPADFMIINRKGEEDLVKNEPIGRNIADKGLGIQYCTSKLQQIVWMAHRIAFLEKEIKKLVGDKYDSEYSRNRGELK